MAVFEVSFDATVFCEGLSAEAPALSSIWFLQSLFRDKKRTENNTIGSFIFLFADLKMMTNLNLSSLTKLMPHSKYCANYHDSTFAVGRILRKNTVHMRNLRIFR